MLNKSLRLLLLLLCTVQVQFSDALTKHFASYFTHTLHSVDMAGYLIAPNQQKNTHNNGTNVFRYYDNSFSSTECNDDIHHLYLISHFVNYFTAAAVCIGVSNALFT